MNIDRPTLEKALASKSLEQIAQEHGVSRQRVYQVAREMGIDVHYFWLHRREKARFKRETKCAK